MAPFIATLEGATMDVVRIMNPDTRAIVEYTNPDPIESTDWVQA